LTEGNTNRIQAGLQQLTGQPIPVRLEMVSGPLAGATVTPASSQSANPAVERRKTLMTLPLFQKANEVLGAQIWHLDEEFNPEAQPKPTSSAPEETEEN